MIEIVLPWPPKELSPNARLHWSKVARVKKAYRRTSYVLATQVLNSENKRTEAVLGLSVSLLFVPPDRRARDHDNMIAAMKSGLDGLADAFKVNDRTFKLSSSVSDKTGGFVVVSVESL